MPPVRIDFYLLDRSESHSRWLFACRLLEKAYRRGHRVFVYCQNQEEAHKLDELLWTYKDTAFIPHNLQGEGPNPPPPPVQIGYQTEPRGFDDLMLNLSDTIPSFYSRFRRVIEIVLNDDLNKEVGRNHFRTYREQQCDLHTHTMSFAEQGSV